MESIRLGRDGIIHDARGVPVTGAVGCLGDVVVLDEACTLRSFMALFGYYPELENINPFIVPRRHEAARCAPHGCTTSLFDVLVLGRIIELSGFPGAPRAEVYHTLRGVPAGENHQEPSQRHAFPGTSADGTRGRATAPEAHECDIRFIPLGELLDMPLRLGTARHTLFGESPRMLDCETTFRLFDVIDGIAWELGFQGGTGHCSLGR